jgi:predicted nucleotidyltransferase
MEEYPDFEEFLKLLNENRVQYLIIGGYAVTFHSSPRFTEDLDVWINNTKSNARKVFKALSSFGFGNIDIRESDLTNEKMIIQLGFKPVRIDVLCGIEGLKFSEAYKRKTMGNFFNVKNVPYISYRDLEISKIFAGRSKDKDALKWLHRHRKKKRE